MNRFPIGTRVAIDGLETEGVVIRHEGLDIVVVWDDAEDDGAELVECRYDASELFLADAQG